MKAITRARVYAYDSTADAYERTSGLVFSGGRILSTDADAVGPGIASIDLDGATVLPAFADCHVHLTDTGYMLGARNLGDTRCYADYAAAVTRLPSEPFVFGGNYDESFWSDGALADAARKAGLEF